MELIMVQQQRIGGTIAATGARVAPQALRGMTMTAGREGVFAAGYLGVGPAVKEYLLESHPETLGRTEGSAAVAAAVAGGVFACFASHPMDTAKTCMQGDLARERFGTVAQTMRTLVQEGGVGALYRGASWRCLRQICSVFLLDKARQVLSPLVFPEAFRD
jgi:hypothetical protein